MIALIIIYGKKYRIIFLDRAEFHEGKNVVGNIVNWKKVIFAGLIFLFGLSRPAIAGMPDPLDQIRDSVNEVLRLLNDENFASEKMQQQRQQMIMEIVDSRFDFWEMSRRTLPRHWEGLSAKEREVFVEKFTALLKNKYVQRLNQYSGESVVFEKQTIKNSRSAVFTHFIHGSQNFSIIYLLRQKETGWLIYDFVIEGVSVVRNYRSQFDTIIKNESFSKLLERIEKKIAPQVP